MGSERLLDATIQAEVSKVVKQESSVTERDLNELDRRIKQLVHETRSKSDSQKPDD